MHLANLLTHQLISGLSTPILEATQRPILYLPTSLLTETRRFLSEIQCTITIPAATTTPYPRANDTHLMDHLNSPNYTAQKLQHINACRLYLQVITLSDICNGQGSHILPEAMQGATITASHTTWAWPRQHRPPEPSWTHWQSAIWEHFLHNTQLALKANCQLGTWTATKYTHHRHWIYHSDPRTGLTWQLQQNATIKIHQPYHYNMARRTTCIQNTPATLAQWFAQRVTTIPVTITTRGAIFQTLSTYHTIQPPSFDPPPTMEPPTLDTWLSQKQHWHKAILQHHNRAYHDSDTRLITAITTNQPIDISVSTNTHRPHFHYGWTLHIADITIWSGSGEISSPQQSNTSRTQLHGVLAALLIISSAREFFLVEPTIPCHLTISDITNKTFQTVTMLLTNPTTGAL